MHRFFTSPKWLLRHVVAVALIITFLLLGRWQYHVWEGARGDLQNLGYALQYPLFAAFVVYVWWKLIRDDLHPPVSPIQPPPVRPERSVGTLAMHGIDADARVAALGSRPNTASDAAPAVAESNQSGAEGARGTVRRGRRTPKLHRDPAPEPQTAAEAATADGDPDLAAYNRYLASLYAGDDNASGRAAKR